jgi:hypothetical protein
LHNIFLFSDLQARNAERADGVSIRSGAAR